MDKIRIKIDHHLKTTTKENIVVRSTLKHKNKIFVTLSAFKYRQHMQYKSCHGDHPKGYSSAVLAKCYLLSPRCSLLPEMKFCFYWTSPQHQALLQHTSIASILCFCGRDCGCAGTWQGRPCFPYFGVYVHKWVYRILQSFYISVSNEPPGGFLCYLTLFTCMPTRNMLMLKFL